MDSQISLRVCLLIIFLVLAPGLALAVTADKEMGPCPCNLRGQVVSWSCVWEGPGPQYPYKLPYVEVELMNCLGGWTKTATDEFGNFEFACVPNPTPSCPFCLRVVDVGFSGYVSSFDAALILRYLVNLETLGKCSFDTGSEILYPQRIAADVNCQNGVNAYDAALILMYAVGVIDHFDCGDEWVYYPVPTCVEDCSQDIMLHCICIGDVSGPSSWPGLLRDGEPAEVELGLPRHYGSYVEVPVRVAGAEDVSSAEFSVAFDPMDFEVVSAEPAGLTEGYMSISSSIGGILRLAMAGANSFSGDGDIALITLEKKRPMITSALNRLILSDVLLNEDTPTVIGHEPGTPEMFKVSLGPISPNPSAGWTTISFDVSKASNVSLNIYSVAGELVRNVFTGKAKAGRNSVTWDGTNANGNEVPRGIYFCRIDSGSLSATGKIVLMK